MRNSMVNLPVYSRPRNCCRGRVVAKSRSLWLVDERTKGQIDADNRKALWHEEFFNLAWSAAVSALCSALLVDKEHRSNLLTFFSLFLPLYSHWMGHQFYLNRFDNSDSIHNWYQLMNCALTALAAANMGTCSTIFLTMPAGGNSTEHQFNASALLVDEYDIATCADYSFLMFLLRLFTALMYLRCAVLVLDSETFCLRKMAESLLFAVAFLLLGLLEEFLIASRSTLIFVWWVVTLTDVLVPFFSHFVFINSSVPLNGDLMIDRFGLFTTTVLGGAFVAATFANSELIYSARVTEYALSVIVVLISLGLMLTYHEGNRGTNDNPGNHALRNYAQQWKGLLWMLLHMPLSAGIVVMNSFFVEGFANSELSTALRWYMCTAMAVVIFSLTALELLHKQPKARLRIPIWIRSLLRCLCAVVILLLPIIPEHSLPLWSLYLCLLAIVFIFIAADALGNRQAQSAGDQSSDTARRSAVNLADIVSAVRMDRTIGGRLISTGLDLAPAEYDNTRLRGRDLDSAYI